MGEAVPTSISFPFAVRHCTGNGVLPVCDTGKAKAGAGRSGLTGAEPADNGDRL